MILLRVQMEGFLCFRDATELDFTSERLTLLCGQNGSGKSAVFDAVLFALFGQHRDGVRYADRLINHFSETARVEVDFRAAEGSCWRAVRTLQRGRTGGSRQHYQLYRLQADGSASPVEGTNNKSGFDNKIGQLLCQTAETFTASVLLQQGQADRLLSNDVSKRFQVLQGLVRLVEFRRLHERVDDERKEAQKEAELLSSQLQSLPNVRPEDLAAAEDRLATEQARLHEAEAHVQELQARLPRAERWVELCQRLEQERSELEPLERLLGQSAAIEADAAELAELEAVVPRLQEVLDRKRRLAEYTERERISRDELTRLEGEVQTAERATEAARLRYDALAQEYTQLQSELSQLAIRKAELRGPLERWSNQTVRRNRLRSAEDQLAELGEDPGPKRTAAQRDARGWERLLDALPEVQSLARRLARLETLRAESAERSALLATVTAEAEQWAEQRSKRTEAMTLARRQRDATSQAVTIADTHRQQARQALERLDGLVGQATCETCGQPLTPAHLAEERARRTAELERWVTQYRTKKSALTESELQVRHAESELAAAEDGHRKSVAERDRLCGESARAEAERDRLVDECRECWHRLPSGLWGPLGLSEKDASAERDWVTESDLPRRLSQDRLAQLQTEVNTSLASARRKEQELANAEKRWQEANAHVEALRRELRDAETQTPSDEEAAQARRELEELDRRNPQLHDRLRQTEQERHQARQALDQQQRSVELAQRARSDGERRLATVEAAAQQCRHELAQLRSLPELADWSHRFDALSAEDLQVLTARRDRLRAEDADGRLRALQQARAAVGVLKPRVDELENQLAAVPDEDRRDPAKLREELATAQSLLPGVRDARTAALAHRDRLVERQAHRNSVDQQHRASDRRRSLLKKLADLLGREGLQRQLIVEAERRIVSSANRMLDNLTRGQLSIRLRTTLDQPDEGELPQNSAEMSEKALDLEAVHLPTGRGRPIGVAFLSGSQRFRVAVTLALAIGELTAGQSTGTVLIDEGFGSLDAEGLDVMLRELQALRDSGRRVVVVSHQERFAESLPEGYRFRLSADGQSQVQRLGQALGVD